jgi:hypothetical protein
MVYQGHVIGGVIVLDEPVQLAEGTAVQIVLTDQGPRIKSNQGPVRSIEEEICAIAAGVPQDEWAQLPADLSDQLDHYLYGTPKR